jgi:hypothetical protein
MKPFQRPGDGYRFAFAGMRVSSPPDALPPNKYAYAANVRATKDATTQTRQGQTLAFATGGNPITDLRAYAQLTPTGVLDDNLPRILARDNADGIYLDSGAKVGQLAVTAGFGATLIPFRPSESPQPWMYIANGADYQKFSAPSPTNVVVAQKVGIAEPQAPVNAAANAPLYEFFTAPVTNGGTAGAPGAVSRIIDDVDAVFPWPAPSVDTWTIQVNGTDTYQRLQVIGIATAPHLVVDVMQTFPEAVGISGIFFFAGGIGRCVIVPYNVAPGGGAEESSLYNATYLGSLRRGSIIYVKQGALTLGCLVLSVTTGPDGTIAIETTINDPAYTNPTSFTTAPAIVVTTRFGGPAPGDTISDLATTSAIATGIGTISGPTVNPLVPATGQSFQPDDYLSIGVQVATLASLVEAKFLIDVSDGTFTKDFYYYTIRPSDIQDAIDNTVTQVSAVQTVVQRALIDEEQAASANNQGNTASSAQMSPGDDQWAQIVIPISSLTRVGSDLTKSLLTAVATQFLFNVSADVNVAFDNYIFVMGAYQADVGDVGAPYQYIVRARSSMTGAVSNPCPEMRYGVNPRRAPVVVTLPSPAYDPQIDTWDIFRYGGSITSYRFIGTVPSTSTTFTDNFDDSAAEAGTPIDYDNFEPWPSVDFPLQNVPAQVIGTVAIVTIVPTNGGPVAPNRWLPGTLVRFGGQNVYTLKTRPTVLDPFIHTYLFQLVENAGYSGATTAYVQEPLLANQLLPYMFGPDAAGTLFGCGDPLRPGTLSFSKSYAPDSVPDTYNQEIVQPSEPLLGGEILDGLAYVGSTERWWALYPQPDNPSQRYNVVQLPLTRGLVAPFGHCNDGTAVYWWAKDGIYSSSTGSLTDVDLYNLFPHEGVAGVNVTYGGATVYAPDYSRAGTFRLEYSNGYLYAIYQDSTGTYRQLTLDVKRGAWCVDAASPVVTAAYHAEQQSGPLLQFTPELYPDTLFGTIDGRVVVQTPLANDLNGPIPCALATREDPGGDLRAREAWGDMYVDLVPAASVGGGVAVTPMTQGAAAAPLVLVPTGAARIQTPVSVGGQLFADFLGMLLAWSDNFAIQAVVTELFVWQPSFLNQPETIADRYSDWDDAGAPGAKWWQGFVLHADTFNAVKGIQIRDADTLAVHPFTPVVQQNGETELAYSFNTPFIAHLVRIEPTDQLPWRYFGVKWVAQPTPEVAETWQTQATTHGLQGYMHLRQMSLTYASADVVTFTATSFDGTSPAPLTFPATGGAVQKIVLPFTFNKGQLYFYRATSALPFQIYVDKSEVEVGGWGRGSAYVNVPLVGGVGGDKAAI